MRDAQRGNVIVQSYKLRVRSLVSLNGHPLSQVQTHELETAYTDSVNLYGTLRQAKGHIREAPAFCAVCMKVAAQ